MLIITRDAGIPPAVNDLYTTNDFIHPIVKVELMRNISISGIFCQVSWIVFVYKLLKSLCM